MMSLQIIVAGMAASSDAAEWGVVLVGLTDGSALGRGIVLADQSGRMPSGEAARRVLMHGPKVSVAAIAREVAPRVAAVFTAAMHGERAIPPPVAPITIGDGAGLWTGLLRELYDRGRLVHNEGLGDLEAALTGYAPGEEAPRVGALLAAVSYLRDIGGLQGAGAPWEHGATPPVIGGMLEGGSGGPMGLSERFDPRLFAKGGRGPT